LNDALQKLKDADWQYAINNLRDLRLIAQAESHEPDTLDCHPLLREYFGEKLKTNNPISWRKAHGRLYEYYKSNAKEFPNTIEEMAPLYAAVLHGCEARQYQETYDKTYLKRIRRGNEYFNSHNLGAMSAELIVLSGFYDLPWNNCVANLREDSRAIILNQTGFCLRSLGRLVEADQLMQTALKISSTQKNWSEAARQANNLSELYLIIGSIAHAQDHAHQSIKLADHSGKWQERIMGRTTFANILHQTYRLSDSEGEFREAEEIQKKNQPGTAFLYALQGYYYCDLLLSRGMVINICAQWCHGRH
jgi:hypothetical protein